MWCPHPLVTSEGTLQVIKIRGIPTTSSFGLSYAKREVRERGVKPSGSTQSVCPGIHPSTKPEQKGKAKPAKEKRDRHDYSILKLESILRTTSDNIRPVSPGDSVLLRLLTEFLPTKLESHSAFAGASCVASTRSLSESHPDARKL
ncbi:hypothetical protein AgCh_004763 [Apium graveolens]